MSLERIYVINMSKVYSLGKHRERARRVVKHIKAFTKRHMKVSEEDIIFSQELNEYVWMNGIQKPPRKIKVKMVKSDVGKVTLSLEKPVVAEKVEKKKTEKKVKKTTEKKEKKVTTKKPASKKKEKEE